MGKPMIWVFTLAWHHNYTRWIGFNDRYCDTRYRALWSYLTLPWCSVYVVFIVILSLRWAHIYNYDFRAYPDSRWLDKYLYRYHGGDHYSGDSFPVLLRPTQNEHHLSWPFSPVAPCPDSLSTLPQFISLSISRDPSSIMKHYRPVHIFTTTIA